MVLRLTSFGAFRRRRRRFLFLCRPSFRRIPWRVAKNAAAFRRVTSLVTSSSTFSAAAAIFARASLTSSSDEDEVDGEEASRGAPPPFGYAADPELNQQYLALGSAAEGILAPEYNRVLCSYPFDSGTMMSGCLSGHPGLDEFLRRIRTR